jgi:hypothetical protein
MHCQVVTEDGMQIVASNREARALATAMLILVKILDNDQMGAQEILEIAIAREGGTGNLCALAVDVGFDVTNAADQGGWLS